MKKGLESLRRKVSAVRDSMLTSARFGTAVTESILVNWAEVLIEGLIDEGLDEEQPEVRD